MKVSVPLTGPGAVGLHAISMRHVRPPFKEPSQESLILRKGADATMLLNLILPLPVLVANTDFAGL
jgi:hypothetical protein